MHTGRDRHPHFQQNDNPQEVAADAQSSLELNSGGTHFTRKMKV